MALMTRLTISHAVALVLGAVLLVLLAFPLEEGAWRFESSINWDLLLAPCLALGVVAGACEGVAVGFGRFWPTLIPLVPTSFVALWAPAFFVAPLDLGDLVLQPTPDLFIAAMSGWALYVVATFLVTLGTGAATAALRAYAVRHRAPRADPCR